MEGGAVMLVTAPGKSWIRDSDVEIVTYTHPVLTYSLHGVVSYFRITGFQLVTKFPAFYGTQMFINLPPSARYLSLPQARSIQSTPQHPPLLEDPS